VFLFLFFVSLVSGYKRFSVESLERSDHQPVELELKGFAPNPNPGIVDEALVMHSLMPTMGPMDLSGWREGSSEQWQIYRSMQRAEGVESNAAPLRSLPFVSIESFKLSAEMRMPVYFAEWENARQVEKLLQKVHYAEGVWAAECKSEGSAGTRYLLSITLDSASQIIAAFCSCPIPSPTVKTCKHICGLYKWLRKLKYN
jgi:hypothetical protein